MFIREALLDLLQTKHLNEITVKELCEKADINRATFYRNYLDIYDLYEKMEQELVDSSFSTGDMKRDRQNMLQLIYDNQNFYRESCMRIGTEIDTALIIQDMCNSNCKWFIASIFYIFFLSE